MSIKLVLADIDGTLVSAGSHEISLAVHESIVNAEKQGAAITAVTGRPFEMAKPVLDILGIDDFCVFDGGATIRHSKTGKLAWSKWLDAQLIKQVVPVLLPHCLSIDFSDEWNERKPETVNINEIIEAAPYVFAVVPNEKVSAIEEELQKIAGITAYTHPGMINFGPEYTNFQITHSEADKEHGVAALLALKQVPKEHVMAIGDSNNDIPLFRAAHVKVAMGNATELLKAQADHIVNTVDKDGFAEAIEKFVLV